MCIYCSRYFRYTGNQNTVPALREFILMYVDRQQNKPANSMSDDQMTKIIVEKDKTEGGRK